MKKVKKVKKVIVTKGIKTAFRPSKKQLAILTAMEKQKQTEDDWRLKAVHHNINQAKKAIYDLSINVEGEHESLAKSIGRCHDRIEIVEGLVIKLIKMIDDDGAGGTVGKQLMTKEETEQRIRAALKGLD